MGVADPVIIEKEMGITYSDFFRIIGNALGSPDFEKWDQGVRLIDGDKKMEITLGPEGQRKIALMVIPLVSRVVPKAELLEEALKAAVKRFDMMFKKGGG